MKRLSSGQGFSLAELEYAVFMGYDSVVLKPDIEIGGVDQLLNMHMCRQMMANAEYIPEIIITYNLLSGTTGEKDSHGRYINKMSKSRGNYIPVNSDPSEMYGKVMSIPDEIMWIWYREFTEITEDELQVLKSFVCDGKLHPKVVKQLLARVIVGTFNFFDLGIIKQAENEFNSKYGKQALLIPDDLKIVLFGEDEIFIETLAKAVDNSKGYIRRLVMQGGVRVLKGDKYVQISIDEINSNTKQWNCFIINIGKHHYIKLLDKESNV